MRSLLVLTTLLGASLALAHDDDPKLRQVSALVPAGVAGPTSGAAGAFEVNGVQLLAQLTPADLGTTMLCADNWGYVSPSGRQYAIQCTEDSTVFVEVTDPQSPVVVGSIAGPAGVWRDAKVYGEYAYSVHETNGVGIQIIDLTQIDQGVVTYVGTIEGTDTGATHNVAINEESGYLYRCGGAYHGLRVYDLSNPANPTYAGSWDARYVHDAQIVTWSDGRELAFCCGGLNSGWSDTGLTIVDVTDKQNMFVVSQLYYPGGQYSHQGWLSEDRQYFYLGDELDEYYNTMATRTHVFSVGDPDNATYLGAFDSTTSQSIGHNMYTHGGLLYQANYRSGLRVFDLNVSALNPPEIAWFDTQPGDDTNDFGGTWSVYPYLPSGIVLLSDREEGLFILRLDEELGSERCAPAPVNSTGMSGVLTATGSAVLAENHVTLTASGLPPGAPALLLVSPGGGGSIDPLSGAGDLCIGVPFGRDLQSAGAADGAGRIDFPIDLGSLPIFGGTQAAQPGETWFFQSLYSDGSQRRLTSARVVTWK